MTAIAENLRAIRLRMDQACSRSGRAQDSVALLAVSKFQSSQRIREAAAAGLKHFAESRQQEAKNKLPELKLLGAWHFIGSLQSNKARSVAELFDVVQSVDTLDLARKLSSVSVEMGKTLGIYAQVNISGEAQKHGFAVQGAEAEIAELSRLPGLKFEGLMGMAAASPDPEASRPAFAALRHLRERLAQQGFHLKLSMGMSADFEAAILEGSDMVRIGTALFA